MFKAISHKLNALHNNEDGMEALQSVILLALGAMVLVGLHSIYDSNVKDATTDNIDTMMELDFTTGE